ncbi:hypothetical protein Dsin_016806 [Dipteronia sinensis]|uniref:TPX2 C-terminal domain-containing protein n=1 Tax=Dipteronia sinensis TaxID=43782 RepID=A0AAE0ADS6_9ROSI|nr:hypothetical protein Dsin_016806 [Dipteronia sinensis]
MEDKLGLNIVLFVCANCLGFCFRVGRKIMIWMVFLLITVCMDSDNLKVVGGLEVALQNGVYKQPVVSGQDRVVLDDVNGTAEEFTETLRLNGDSESISKLDDSGTTGEEVTEGSNANVGSNGSTVSEGSEVKVDTSKQPKPHKGQSKNKNEKPLSTKNVSSTEVKKGKDGKGAEATPTVSNGLGGLNSHSKQPVKNRSFNDRQVHVSKQSRKPDATSSEGLVEKAKPKTLKKVTPENADKDAQSSSSTPGDAKPRKVGALPAYGFSFKCDERAEKRREFYTKLEEKIHAKEMEKTNMQAKSKEHQEAEIKILRKSLNFKATPMPTFYQEPPPPKVELKKIPTTRAKSPKLGRKKTSASGDLEGNDTPTFRPVRLSLDEKVTSSISTKGISPVHTKKPQRKSLPKLPSEKISLSDSKSEDSSISPEEPKVEHTTTPSASLTHEQESTPAVDPGKIQPQTGDEGSSPVVGEQAQPTSVQEGIAMEN